MLAFLAASAVYDNTYRRSDRQPREGHAGVPRLESVVLHTGYSHDEQLWIVNYELSNRSLTYCSESDASPFHALPGEDVMDKDAQTK